MNPQKKSTKRRKSHNKKNNSKISFIEIEGVVDMTSQGSAYIIPNATETQQLDNDIFVSQKNLGPALHSDKVKVQVFIKNSNKKSNRLEGRVIEILQRGRKRYLGSFVNLPEQNCAFVILEGKDLGREVIITNTKHAAEDGDKVVVALEVGKNFNQKTLVGQIVEVLGKPGIHETEMRCILEESGVFNDFPKEVLEETAKMPAKIPQSEIKVRRDFRKIHTITIDPFSAKDFDDALSLEILPDKTYQIGVHIADVSHYVTPKSAIDKEAIERATSVYMVDRTVGMLPPKLSDDLCSLKPNVDRLCMSAVFTMTPEGEILNQWFGKTVIHSDIRFAYEEVDAIFENVSQPKEDWAKEMLLILNSVAQNLRALRFKNGSLNFDRPEPYFELDEKTGKPLKVLFSENTASHQLIEEFMLLANQQVAKYCLNVRDNSTKNSPERVKKGKVGVFRIHDTPNQEKIEKFADFVKKFGYTIKTTSPKVISKSLAKLMTDVHGKNEGNMIETLALRSMAKAEYSTQNIGHYGLGFKYYSHFTSPIRRYPDLLTHRILKHYLYGEGEQPNQTSLENLCVHCSQMEKKATDAERASIKYKQIEFMSDKIGEEFDGIISGVTEWGIYVEINETKGEGMISIRDMQDDFYIFDEENYLVKGRRHGRIFRLGDPIRVKVTRANLLKRQLDFCLADEEIAQKPQTQSTKTSKKTSKSKSKRTK